MAVKNLVAIVQQPVVDQWRNASLLGALCGVLSVGCVHEFLLFVNEVHWQRRV